MIYLRRLKTKYVMLGKKGGCTFWKSWEYLKYIVIHTLYVPYPNNGYIKVQYGRSSTEPLNLYRTSKLVQLWFCVVMSYIWRAEIQKEHFRTMLWPIGILTSILRYTLISQYVKVPINCFSLNVITSILHSICPCLRHRPKMLLLDFRPSYHFPPF